MMTCTTTSSANSTMALSGFSNPGKKAFSYDGSVLVGTSALIGRGNAGHNRIVGNASANSLFGGAGEDTLEGGAATTVIELGYTIADLVAKVVFGVMIFMIAVRKSQYSAKA